MKKIYSCLIISSALLISVFTQKVSAQLVVDGTISVSTMMHDFFDTSCVSISNVTYNGALDAVGFFDASGTGMGINAGFMLSSGTIGNAVGPNISSGTTGMNNTAGDLDLDLLATYPTYDAAVIEMDITPSLDTLYFKYVFGSEEYSEYVNSSFNDVFAFYVSGPGITGVQNIALVPGTNDPLSINTVNCISANTQYYVCNDPYNSSCNASYDCYDSLRNATLEYDGFTVPVSAQITVIPDSTYHVKLAIADASDYILDSGIFIGIESLCGDGVLKPVPDYTYTIDDNTVHFFNQSRYATSLSWDFGDNITSTDLNPVHTYTLPGNYNVTLTVQNYCCTDALTQPLQIGSATGIQNVNNDLVNIFPNPTKGLVNIQLPEGQEGMVILFDHSGKKLSSFQITSHSSFDLSSFEKGMLFMQVISNGKVYLKKIELN